MPIIDLQRRLREIGRLRAGARGEKGNPTKLEAWRLTSRDQAVIEAAAERWGGVCQPWTGADGSDQWEVFTNTDQMSVIIPPGDMAYSVFYEQWAAGGCKVRCDGAWDTISDSECHCDPEERACDIHSRLSVMLPDLPGMGVWRLDTQGYYAAVELGGVVDIIASFSARGVMLPARLRLEQRSVKRTGQQVKRFIVPVLDVDVNPMVLTGQVNVSTGELSSPNITPVPAALTAGQGGASVAEQVSVVAEPKPRRSNAAAPLPAIDLAPRTAAEFEYGPDEEPFTEANETSDFITAKQLKMVGALFTKAGITNRDDRLSYASEVAGRTLGSSKELTKAEASKLIDELQTLEAAPTLDGIA